jgi:hypothetical protein
MATSSPTNPYESPGEAKDRPPDFSDRETAELADVRRRLEALERRVGRSWMVHSNVFLRILGVWGHFLLGYALVFAIVFVTAAIVWLVSGHWFM